MRDTTRDEQCALHGPYSAEVVVIRGREVASGCPVCLEKMDESQVKAQREAQDAADAAEFKAFLKQSNIEQDYLEATLVTFKADTPELQKALAAVKRLLSGEITKLVFTGKNGTGKTHLAVAAILDRGAGRILTMYEISVTIRATYTAQARRTELEVVDELARLPILAIDEMGRTKGGDAEQNWLSYLLDKRHVRKLPTILISNKHVRAHCPEKDTPAKGCPDCLENYMGEDVMSRLSDGGLLLRFTGDDWRRKR